VSDAAWAVAEKRRFVQEALDADPQAESELLDFLGDLLRVSDAERDVPEHHERRKNVTVGSGSGYLSHRIEAISRLAAEAAAGDAAILSFRTNILKRDSPMSANEAEAYLDRDDARKAGSRSTSAGPDEILHYQNRKIYHSVHVWSGSPLDKLRRLAATLTESYPWVPEQAAAFVLEGLTPRAAPFAFRFPQTLHDGRPRRAKVVMEIDLWMPAPYVLKAYRDLQRQVLPGHNRPVSGKTIDVVNFVLQHRPATWPQLLALWNNAHPSAAYGDYRHLRYAFERARRSLLTPRYRTYFGPDA
jgi:hypothetical protein